jgi:hypothetical protein
MIVYAVVWTAAVAIHGVRFFPFYDLAPYTWAAIALAFVAFVAGGFAARRVVGQRTGGGDVVATTLTTTMRVYFALGLAGAGLFMWRVHRVLGIDALVSRPIDVHSALADRTIASSHLFLYYFGVAAMVLFGYLCLTVRRRPRRVDIGLFVLFLVAMALSTERNHMLWALACWLFLLLAPPAGDAQLKRLAATAAIVGAVAVGFYLGAGSWLGKSADNIAGALVIEAAVADPATPAATIARLRTAGAVPDLERDAPPGSRLHWILPGGLLHRFATLYMSIGAALPSLDQGLRHHERSYGQLTFRPVFRVLSRLGLVSDTLQLTSYDEVRTPYPANAYTYLYEHVRDFGLAGAVVVPGLLGLLAGGLYTLAARTPGSFWSVWLAMVQGMVLWSPFQNRFMLTVSAYLVAATVVAYAVSRRKGPQAVT